ncbi:glycosyltransferase [Cereibacter sphaeroides]|uniref:glycosyltransferase n=1 Tax=Cereibacter sphaeroides TaxID=1063 RepID=UPI001F2112DB|nr:glycosyltransferase family 2 protein [Cereibacter sphaeroides]MCE6950271.1 glycosyltransferase [Cereibacter sphaeroides]MCE6958695.1 glycosyltransferase [Cereibacter sphaeroides]MCE6973422.1 glycosyltransferase [Cereibacter sphaeroides]
MTALSVIIPASNEAGYIGRCLQALHRQDLDPRRVGGAEILIAANACRDATVAEAEAERAGLEAAGWRLIVMDLPEPGKLNALNHAEGRASGRVLVYLDADVICEPPLMRLLVEALDIGAARYASGQLKVAPPRSRVTRHFARVWTRLPFMTTNVQGAGLFAVNRAGRSRWGGFPDIIADDGYVRLMFAPEERIKVDAAYHWPLVEGFSQLVKVRRRQDAGVRQLEARYPAIMANESKPPMTPGDHLRLFLQTPLSYTVYVLVMLAVKSGRSGTRDWTRGR